jgi:hypothetical protein
MASNHFFRNSIVKILFACQLLMFSAVAFAQEKKVEISIGKKNNWYEQPWAWVVGAAVFILLLVAILRSGKKNQ